VLLVERDVRHPLLGLLGVHESERGDGLAARESSVEEWQREASKLELQGKAEQADAIRARILNLTPVPWQVLDRPGYAAFVEKAFAPKSPFTKAKQALFAFAAANDTEVLAARLASDAGFAPAGGRDALARERKATTERSLAPYRAKRPDEVLRAVERHGVDHRSPANHTPLMLAARAGNVDLLDALLARGARRDLVDTFGQTAAQWALREALASPAYAQGPMAEVWERVAPSTIDVQVHGRLFKIGREHGEHFFLLASLAAWPTRFVSRLQGPLPLTGTLLSRGFDTLPANVVRPERRKRKYVNHLLSRCTVGSNYVPNRELWVRTKHGEYDLNPELSIRAPELQDLRGGGGDSAWWPVHRLLGAEALRACLAPLARGEGR